MYCNYSKDKFGNELTFISPCWLDIKTIDVNNKNILFTDINSSEYTYLNYLLNIESNYLELIKKGWTPQQARTVLPNSLKTELVMTGFVEDWKHFFDLRCAPSAHPQARELAIPLEEEFKSYMTCLTLNIQILKLITISQMNT